MTTTNSKINRNKSMREKPCRVEEGTLEEGAEGAATRIASRTAKHTGALVLGTSKRKRKVKI